AILRSNLACALLRAGEPAAARRTLEVDVADHLDLSNWAIHFELAQVDLVDGHLDRARAVMGEVAALSMHVLAHRAEVIAACAEVEVWNGRPADGLARLTPFLEELAA